jgi:hypothetical protein
MRGSPEAKVTEAGTIAKGAGGGNGENRGKSAGGAGGGGALTARSFPAREQWCRWITNDGDYTQRTCDGTEPGFDDDRPAGICPAFNEGEPLPVCTPACDAGRVCKPTATAGEGTCL